MADRRWQIGDRRKEREKDHCKFSIVKCKLQNEESR
jgi:hypothetical protein